jgi:signal transduction histidine kinase
LQRLNAELEEAKNEADAANLSKTRFLAAASHDILQPLNAARLYASSLSEGAN